jgi:hypothetical protein
MRSSLKHIMSQPFVVATGFAALIHSTWSLAVLFNGHEPEQFGGTWLAWVAPALLIALSIDLGQVVTAAEIRSGQRSRIKLATFATFALATYGLQWFHLAHHSPLLQLAAGVRADWQPLAQFISDAMLWFVPALLPLSTLLYTFSSADAVQESPVQSAKPVIAAQQNTTINILQPAKEVQATHADGNAADLPAMLKPPEHIAECICGWRGAYDSARGATNALTAHRRKCETYVKQNAEVNNVS